MNAPHKINGKQLDVKKALPKDGGEQRGGRQGGPGGRNDNWGGNTGMHNFILGFTLYYIYYEKFLTKLFLILQVVMVTLREDGTTQTLGITTKEAGVVTREVDMGVVIREAEEEAGAIKILAITTNRVIVGAQQGTNNTAITVLHHTT